MLLAEDLLLLLTDDATGKAQVDSTRLDLALAGAVLLELAERGRVSIAQPGGPVKAGRVVVHDPSPIGSPVLDEALRRIAERRPSTPQDLLPRMAKGLRAGLLADLARRGILRHEENRVLRVFASRSWPAADSAHEDAVRRGLHDVLVVGRTPSPREAALISLLHAVDRVPNVVGDALDKRELRRRAKAIAEGEFAGAAVRKAVEAVDAAVMATILASTVAASNG